MRISRKKFRAFFEKFVSRPTSVTSPGQESTGEILHAASGTIRLAFPALRFVSVASRLFRALGARQLLIYLFIGKLNSEKTVLRKKKSVSRFVASPRRGMHRPFSKTD